MALRVKPLTLAQLNDYVREHHRHHKPVQGHRFSLGVIDDATGELVGACSVGRPVARMIPAYEVAEVTRLVTNGTKNACSILYAAAARACQAMGFLKIQTYILHDELGTSLKASGWVKEADSTGGKWARSSRPDRREDQPDCIKQRWARSF